MSLSVTTGHCFPSVWDILPSASCPAIFPKHQGNNFQ